MNPTDVLAFIAPTCVIYTGFAYWRVMKMRIEVGELKKNFEQTVKDMALNRDADNQRMTKLRLEIEQVRQGFIQERTCPACDTVRAASQFEQGDYICRECREEKNDEPLDSKPEDGVPC